VKKDGENNREFQGPLLQLLMLDPSTCRSSQAESRSLGLVKKHYSV
jgi:hypothetical protein